MTLTLTYYIIINEMC